MFVVAAVFLKQVLELRDDGEPRNGQRTQDMSRVIREGLTSVTSRTFFGMFKWRQLGNCRVMLLTVERCERVAAITVLCFSCLEQVSVASFQGEAIKTLGYYSYSVALRCSPYPL